MVPAYFAVSTTEVEVVTVPAATGKLAETDPCGIVTAAGTLALDTFELENDILAPPAGAAVVSLTLPTADRPLMIVLGVTEIPLRAAGGGSMVKENVSLIPPYEAVRVTGVAALTTAGITGNVTDVEPCGTVTVLGTAADAGLEVDKETTTPPVPAGAVRVSVAIPD